MMVDYYDDEMTLYDLMRDLYIAGSICCALFALHRIARGLRMQAQVKAYDELADAYTPEEREELIHRIKTESLSGGCRCR